MEYVANLPAVETAKDPMMPDWFVVQRAFRETSDTVTLEFSSRSDRLVSFAPGQFNMMYVYGVGEVPISISGDPAQPQKLIHTIRAVGCITKAICACRRGDLLGIRGPYGSAWPVQRAIGKDVVIAAGGVGLAPLRSAIYSILNNRQDFGRVSILYGARSPEDLLFKKELERWRSRFDVELEITVDQAWNKWKGNVGVVTTLIERIQFDPENCMVFVCGPEIMMRFTIQEIRYRGVTKENIYLSAERNMKCGIGFCGHCQYGPHFVCKDGPVFVYEAVEAFLGRREI